MKKRILTGLLAALLLVLTLAPAGMALETNIAVGTCGEGITWSLDGYTLTVSGSGETMDGAPWAEHADHIEHVVFTGGITKIGADSFYKFDRIKTVDFGDDLVEIGERAFYGCDDIEFIHLPKTFRIFGAEAFRGCTSLKNVYCDGGMPRFNESCLWTGEYISVFYRGNNPWPADPVQQLVANFGGRLGVMMGSFEDSVWAEAETEPVQTEPAETEPRETEPETVPTTAATEPTAAPTLPPETEPAVTVAATVPQTQPAETQPVRETVAVPETEFTMELEQEQETTADVVQTVEDNSWIGMVLIAGVLTFLIAGALIFRILSRRSRRRKNRRGGRYKR